MSIDERLMQPGRWRIDLARETPLAVRTGIVWRDHFAVTAARLSRPTYDQVRTSSIYAGVVLERDRRGPESPVAFGGLNLLYWLGDASMGYPAGVTTGSRSATITTLLNELWSVGNSIGDLTLTLSSVPATTIIDVIASNFVNDTTMKMIDRWRRKTSPQTEFALRHPGEVVFSQAGAGSAFVQTPKIVFTRDDMVLVGGGRHVIADEIQEAGDAFDEDYSIDIYATDALSSGGSTNADFTGRLSYPLVNNSTARRASKSTSEVAGAGAPQNAADAYIAAGQLRLQRRRLVITLPGGSLLPNVDLAVGDYVYLYDPWTGCVDTANKVAAAGTEIHPQKVRVTGIEWGIPEGAGVYWLKTQSGAGAGTGSSAANAVDLSDLVEDRGRQIRLMIDTAEPVRAPAFRSSKLS